MQSFERSAVAVPAAIGTMRRGVASYALSAGLSPVCIDDLNLALTEAVTNVVVHAYVDAPEQGAVRVHALAGAADLVVTVSDDGRGMVPRTDSPGMGVGLSLIARLAAAVEIRAQDRGGVHLRMAFPIGRAA